MSSYISKQTLAMSYFPDRSKERAGKLLAREIHTNEPLMAELSKTAYSPQRKLLSPNNSKSSSPSSASHSPPSTIDYTPTQPRGCLISIPFPNENRLFGTNFKLLVK